MNKETRTTKARKHETKMVFTAFSPAGAPREPGRERYFLSYAWLDKMIGDWRGENNV